METVIPQYGLQTMLEISEDYTDAGELGKLRDIHKLPNIVSVSETEKGARKRGLRGQTLEKIDQKNEAKKFAERGIDKVDTALS